MSQSVTSEYDPNDISTWPTYSAAGRDTYVQVSELEFDDSQEKQTNYDQENENLTVDVDGITVYIYPEGVECSSESEHEQILIDNHDDVETVQEYLCDEGYINDTEQQYAAQEAVGLSQVDAMSVNTEGMDVDTQVKQIAWEVCQWTWNEVDSMDSMTKLETRTARQKFETWWEMNHGSDE